MRTLKRATRWQTIITQAGTRATIKAHQTQLPVPPFQSRRMLKTWHPAHLPQVVTANKVADVAAEIRGGVGMAKNGGRAESVVTIGGGVRSRMWAALNGGILHVSLN